MIYFLCVIEINAEDVYSPGEELVYNVSYLGIELGKIKIESLDEDSLNGLSCYKTIIHINTYPDIPFIDFRVIYREWIDKSLHFSQKFITNTYYDENDWGYGEINYNYKDGNIKIKSWRHDEIEFEKFLATKKKWCNGLTMIFIMRKYANEKKSLRVPVTLNNDTTIAWLHLSAKKEMVYVESMQKEISCFYTQGKIGKTSLYGLGGDFEIWFSDDDARVPVLAKINIVIGSAVVELQSWKRKDWKP